MFNKVFNVDQLITEVSKDCHSKMILLGTSIVVHLKTQLNETPAARMWNPFRWKSLSVFCFERFGLAGNYLKVLNDLS